MSLHITTKQTIDHRIRMKKVADDFCTSIDSCHNNFSVVLGMKHVTAKFVHKKLNLEQKQVVCKLLSR